MLGRASGPWFFDVTAGGQDGNSDPVIRVIYVRHMYMAAVLVESESSSMDMTVRLSAYICYTWICRTIHSRARMAMAIMG